MATDANPPMPEFSTDYLLQEVDPSWLTGAVVDRCPTGVIILGKAITTPSAGDPHQRDHRHGYTYGVRF